MNRRELLGMIAALPCFQWMKKRTWPTDEATDISYDTLPGLLTGRFIMVTSGPGLGEVREVIDDVGNLNAPWNVQPDATSMFHIFPLAAPATRDTESPLLCVPGHKDYGVRSATTSVPDR